MNYDEVIPIANVSFIEGTSNSNTGTRKRRFSIEDNWDELNELPEDEPIGWAEP